MKPTVYVETSVISYLAARPSRDLIVAAHQQISQAWWEARQRWALSVSALVVAESRAGYMEAAQRRLALLEGLPLLLVSDAAVELAGCLLERAALPAGATDDALHVAIAAVYGVDYLLTWNCKHIANAYQRPRIEAVCRALAFQPPVICTPEELLGGFDVD
jgi:predicted nucleic acid-binding protein